MPTTRTHTSTAATRLVSPTTVLQHQTVPQRQIVPQRRGLLSNSCTTKSGKRLVRMSVVSRRWRGMGGRRKSRACSSMLPKDSGCIGIIDWTRSFSCLLASFYSFLVFFVAIPGPRIVSRAMRATIGDCETLDVESWFIASSLTTVVRLGMPTVRFGIPFTTLKRRFYITNGTAPGSNPTAHRTAPRSRPTRTAGSRQGDPTFPATAGGLLGISNKSATNWRDKARASPLRSRAASTRNGIVGRTDTAPMQHA